VKKGDLVRFKIYQARPRTSADCGIWRTELGILIEYKTWEKVATILSEGKIYRIHASDVEKAGKKDELRNCKD